MLELTHVKVDGPCQIAIATGQETPALVCVVGQPVPSAETLQPSAAGRSECVELFGAGARQAGEAFLTAVGIVGAIFLALCVEGLWPIIAEFGRLVGILFCYSTGHGGRIISNRLLQAGAELHGRSHVLQAGAALYSRLPLPRLTSRRLRAEQDLFATKVEG